MGNTSSTHNCNVVFLGLDFNGGSADESEGHDRDTIELPGNQAALVEALREAAPATPIVAVLIHGGSLNLAGAADQLDAPHCLGWTRGFLLDRRARRRLSNTSFVAAL